VSKLKPNWKFSRVVVQIAAFIALLVFFFTLAYPLNTPWRPDLLFELDPLMHVYLLVSGEGFRNWIFFAATVLMLVAISRIFCGWICPLGGMLDFATAIRGRLKLWNRIRPPHASNRNTRRVLPAFFNVYFLIALLVLAAFGNPLVWLFDPIVFSFKFLTVTVLPAIDIPLRTAFNWFDGMYYQQEWWWPFQDGYNKYFSMYHAPAYADTTWVLLLAGIIFGLEMFQKRFWCRNICPLGALCRLTYLLHPVKRRITDECTSCMKCEVGCHFGGTSETDCIYCMECIMHCPPNTISFLPKTKAINEPKQTSVEHEKLAARKRLTEGTKPAMLARIKGDMPRSKVSRRLALQYGGTALVAVPLVRMLDGRTEPPDDFIRPPGVTDEARFNELCIKCGECLKVCLTNALQPALTEAGLSALWTPRFNFRLGYCEYNCNLCGKVCPTRAIPKLHLRQKKQTYLGIAYFNRDKCIPFVTTKSCTVCEEHCPTPEKAIKFRTATVLDQLDVAHETLQPYIVPELCIGCGICEYVCPVPKVAAVRIYRRPEGAAYDPPSQALQPPEESTASGEADTFSYP